MADWVHLIADGVRFAVRLTPAGGANAVQGLATDAAGETHLKARVTAIAEKNKANAALIALLSKELKVARGEITIVSGQTSRLKTVEIHGPAAELAEKLEALARG